MRILLPISLDRWRNPIATLLRACVEANPEIEFHSASNPISEEDRRLGIDFWSQPNIRKSSQAKLATTRFDIVHTASITAHNQAAVVAAKLRNPGRCQYLSTINLQVGPADGKDWHLLRVAEKLADGFIAVSKAAGEGTSLRCPDRFLGIIPNGFDPEYFDPAIEDDDAVPPQIRDLQPGSFPLYVGALEPRKHPEFFVKLAQSHPEITFVGAGYLHPLGRHFEPMVKAVPNLIWLGHVDRRVIRALLKRAGVFLFPSEREGLALSVIEALGMGLPVIGQPKTSMPELITDGVNGHLFDISDQDGWSNALLATLGVGSEGRHFASSAIRAATMDRFAWQSIGRRYESIYREIFSR
jgi:glycosyltransferase involved in cell wall biosynthesis